MGRKKIIINESVEPVATPVLDSLNLKKGEEVRFRRNIGQGWLYGKIHGDNSDGSISIVEYKMGHIRAMLIDNVQIKTSGPRGGIVWEDINGNIT